MGARIGLSEIEEYTVTAARCCQGHKTVRLVLLQGFCQPVRANPC